MKLIKTAFVSGLALLSATVFATQWEKIRTPIEGKAQSIGGIATAVLLALNRLH